MSEKLSSGGRSLESEISSRSEEPVDGFDFVHSYPFSVTLMENLNLAILVEDRQRRVLYNNTVFCKMFGIPAEISLVGMDCAASASESASLFQDPDRFIVRIEEILRARQPVTGEEWTLADGRTFRRDYIPLDQPNGFFGNLWKYEDITAARHLAHQVQQKGEQQAALAKLSLLALTGTDLQRLMDEVSEIVVAVLQADYCTILEALPEHDELLMRSGAGWKPGVIGLARIKADEQTLAGYAMVSNQPVRVDDFGDKGHFYSLPLLEDRYMASAMAFPIPGTLLSHSAVGSDGPRKEYPWGVIVVHSRTTSQFSQNEMHFLQSVAHLLAAAIRREKDRVEQQRTERDLRSSEARHRALLEALPDLIFVISRDGVYLDYNAPSPQSLYVPPGQFLGKNMWDVMPADLNNQFLAFWPRVLDQGETVRFEYSLPIDDQLMFFEARLAAIGQDRVLAIIHDITSLKLAEQHLRRANRALWTLSECNEALVRATHERALLQEICDILTSTGGYLLAWIGYKDEPTRLVKPVAASGEKKGYMEGLIVTYEDTPYGRGPAGRAVRSEEIQIAQSIEIDASYAPWREKSRIFGLRSLASLPLSVGGEVIGCLNIYSGEQNAFSAEETRLLTELANDVAYGIYSLRQQAERQRAEQLLARANVSLMEAYDATIEGWASALELREKETAGHSRRVVDLTVQIARYMGMPEEQIQYVHYGALLHDIGKMGVPHELLMKPGPLDEEEWAVMRCHPQIAYELLKEIAYLKPAIDIPFYHHERWDGRGYPKGLKGDEIPLAARVFAVVDVWDALTSKRPYRDAWPVEAVCDYIRQQAGKHFDPGIAGLFLEHFAK